MSLVPVAVGRAIARNALLLQKNSPGILFGAGVIGMVGSTVLACRATLKMEEVMSEALEKKELANNLDHPEYSERDRHNDLKLIRIQTGYKIMKLYGPPIIVGVISIAALTKSHRILTQRNVALTAAYAALERGFAEYRTRVIAKYGEEEDQFLRYGTTELTVTDEKGKTKTVVRAAPGDPSIYAVFFDELSTNWSRDPDYNYVFLKCQQNYMNDLLITRGHVFLNEVYDALGLPRTEPGAVVGWLYMRDGSTDNHISFGIFEDTKDTRIRDFVNGYEGSVLLDFNVDGVIYDKIGRKDLPWQRET